MNKQQFMEMFAQRLRRGLQYRQENGHPMTQHRLAEETGLHFSLINKYAKARRMPSACHAAVIAGALGVDLGWLCGVK